MQSHVGIGLQRIFQSIVTFLKVMKYMLERRELFCMLLVTPCLKA